VDHVLIVAGGSGSRMGAEVPKQFLEIAGKPVLMHTLGKMRESLPQASLTLVLPEAQISLWKELCKRYSFQIDHAVTAGGSTRTESVRNGLNAIKVDDGVVGIHDGVRPCLSVEMIQRCFLTAAEKGNATPVVPVIPSLRRVVGEDSEAVDRGQFRAVQTPQCFRLSEIRKAYAESDGGYSDDASLMESFGHTIQLVEGDQNNIKITYPLDVKLAEMLLS
jgi:2-C-methyl-D-erythritol 4-phosphate cytidylyltransferase